MPVDSRLLQGRILAGRYVVGEILRQTETTSTYRAKHVEGGYDLEIESVRPGLGKHAAGRTLRDAAHARARILHPQVLRPVDIGELGDGTPFVVSPAAKGATLREHVLLHDPLSAADAMQLARDVLSTLASAHTASVVHGALDPDGIVIGTEASVSSLVCVRGFGSAATTSEYRAPELANARESTIAGDLYSSAGVLFFAVTGFAPGTRGVFGVPHALSRVIVRGSDADPTKRYGSALDMLRAFEGQPTSSDEWPIESEVVPVDRGLLHDAVTDPGYARVLTRTVTPVR
jgi:serine/threonine protein kinase